MVIDPNFQILFNLYIIYLIYSVIAGVVPWAIDTHSTEKWPIDNWNCYIKFRENGPLKFQVYW